MRCRNSGAPSSQRVRSSGWSEWAVARDLLGELSAFYLQIPAALKDSKSLINAFCRYDSKSSQ